MQAEPVTFEWEYSKENVQPLRGGRKVDAIKKGLAKPQSKGLQINASFDDLKRHVFHIVHEYRKANYSNTGRNTKIKLKIIKERTPYRYGSSKCPI